MKKQMKRISVVTLICMLVCTVSCLLPAHAEEQPITVFIDGVQVQFDVNPQMENERNRRSFSVNPNKQQGLSH